MICAPKGARATRNGSKRNALLSPSLVDYVRAVGEWRTCRHTRSRIRADEWRAPRASREMHGERAKCVKT